MKTIRSKMLLALFASMLVTVAFTVLFFIHLFDDILLNQVKEQLNGQTKKAVKIIRVDDLEDLDNDSFRFFIKDILFYADYFVIDGQDKIVASSSAGRVGMKLEGFPGTHEGYMILNGKKVLYSEAELSHKQFRVILYSPLSSLRAMYIPLFRTTLLSIAASFVVILLIGLFAVWRTVQPLNRLKEAVNKYEPNMPDRDQFLQADHTEIGELIQTFQLMSNRIDDHHRHQLEFLQNVSHELKTPLMSIQGYVYAIQDQVVSTDQGLDIIATQSQRLIDMVGKLIQLSRLETVDEEWPVTVIDLKNMAEEAVYLLMPTALQRGIHLTAEANSFIVETAGEQLFQILLNLLQNAVRHTETQVKLTLELSADDHADWIFHVDDDGPGLNEHDGEHIFRRFYTGNNGVTGLGLTISKQLATRLHADLVYSDSPLGGARFSLRHYPAEREIQHQGA
ncbi:HAMP domain-containing sensor histidine kinase [Paenibacillus polysaccharolyticus]|uniref:sensor histidine kinase n=1 Tax=Paenibacillus polysaccharolyticus TaxID=582692 RepID=UPI00300A5CCB